MAPRAPAPAQAAPAQRPAAATRPPRGPDGAVAAVLKASTGATYGERPESPFGSVPVSELAILVGGIGALVGLIAGESLPLIVGIVVCVLGVLEFTVREHFSGYRSHASLLAAVPAVAIVALSVAVMGTPRDRSTRELMLASAVPVFGLLFWLLRKRFAAARQARIIRPPGA